TVDQYRELDALGAPVVHQCVERGANRAAGVQHVVHHDHVGPLERLGYVTGPNAGVGQGGGCIVSVQRDVDGPEWDFTFQLSEPALQARGDGHPAAAYADQDQVGRSAVPLDDLSRHPSETTI